MVRKAIEASVGMPPRRQMKQLLPLEPAVLEAGRSKQTSNPASAVRRALERKEAEKFYREELGWPKDTFNCVAWDGLEATLEKKGTPSACG